MARHNDTLKVGVVMGSDSDWDIMQHAVEQLTSFGIACEARVLSAHRTPDDALAFAAGAADNGFACIIAGAGGAAHLAGVLAAKTTLPVLGVPIPSKYLRGEDSLLSTVQMPKGIPVATFAIGEAGAANAALFAVAMLARNDETLARKLVEFRAAQRDKVRAMKLPPRKS
jgi:5-(carboxyamino)imidazole ribonucleotide mutase